MATEALQKEIAGLPESDINILLEFAHFLRSRFENSQMVEDVDNNVTYPKRKLGFLADTFISISPDFDDLPECLKEYV